MFLFVCLFFLKGSATTTTKKIKKKSKEKVTEKKMKKEINQASQLSTLIIIVSPSKTVGNLDIQSRQ